ncbi:YciI family protein [Rivibacter subsaxonicus]|uniref:YCII-related domain-containing protein n=1 Tax=Rivibacter subsaxonicus TaxID=457575 RepID=A0A4Q7W0A3_9BURK|nr:YciI family protein [Rivibacter subsaxonicus]RZU02632.1 YCII-related domain-containing protein [Rivibacter subsaxonicus]
MPDRRSALSASLPLLLAALAGADAAAQPASAPAPASRPDDRRLFAVEIRTGPAWDAAKPPGEQAHFREHSTNLRRLREQGSLLLGARYADKGLVVLAAASEQEARAMLEQDPAIQNRVFGYELHPFAVFYGGCVESGRPRG